MPKAVTLLWHVGAPPGSRPVHWFLRCPTPPELPGYIPPPPSIRTLLEECCWLASNWATSLIWVGPSNDLDPPIWNRIPCVPMRRLTWDAKGKKKTTTVKNLESRQQQHLCQNGRGFPKVRIDVQMSMSAINHEMTRKTTTEGTN